MNRASDHVEFRPGLPPADRDPGEPGGASRQPSRQPSRQEVRRRGPVRVPGWVALGLFVGCLGIGTVVSGQSGGGSADDAASKQGLKRYMMPSVTLQEFVDRGTRTCHSWKGRTLPLVGDRAKLFEAFRELLTAYDAFQSEVGKVYPENQLEWLLVTDSVADTLADVLHDVLVEYRKRNEDEILTVGRQKFEKKMMEIVGPPKRVLGFHVVLLADHAFEQADLLLAQPSLDDRAGVYDGVLRHALDWVGLWEQVHDNPLTIYESRLAQEDWILVRIEDECGNTGKWRIAEQYMAMIGIDSTVTPAVERFAHEFHLVGTECEDERVFYIDLPNFTEMQMYVIENQLLAP